MSEDVLRHFDEARPETGYYTGRALFQSREDAGKDNPRSGQLQQAEASSPQQLSAFRRYAEEAGLQLEAVQETALQTMEKLSAVLGVKFYIYQSYGRDGKRYYVDESGREKAAPNGKYYADGRIYVDLNAGDGGKGTMLYTVSHELTHFIRQWSKAKYEVLADFFVEQYGRAGLRADNLVVEQMAKARRQGRKLSWEEAHEEMVADSMEAMLTDGNVVRTMAELKRQDKTLWQKICRWFRNLAEDLKAVVEAYKGHKPDSAEGQMVAGMRDVIGKLESLYADALMDAGENFRAASDVFKLGAEEKLSGRNKNPALANKGKSHYNKGKYQERFFPGNVFPPSNESHSRVHETAVQWASSESTNVGDRKLVQYQGTYYMIEAFDDMDFGYLIMKKYSARNYKEDLREYGEIDSKESLQKRVDRVDAYHRERFGDGDRRRDVGAFELGHGGENLPILSVDKDEAGWRKDSGTTQRDRESGSGDRRRDNGSSVEQTKRGLLSAEDVAGWTGEDWTRYFGKISREKGKMAARERLKELASQGLIPNEMLIHASAGTRGGNSRGAYTSSGPSGHLPLRGEGFPSETQAQQTAQIVDAESYARRLQEVMPEFGAENADAGWRRGQKEVTKQEIHNGLEKSGQYDKIAAEIRSVGGFAKNAKVHIPSQKIVLSELSFDDYHINEQRKHNVTREMAEKWIQESIASVTVWNGMYERYYGVEGAVYVDLQQGKIRTAFSAEEFDEKTMKLLEVFRKYGY